MTSAATAWMPLFIADYLRDTMRLSTEQHGAYMLLIMDAWSHGGVLPNDQPQLAGIAKMSLPAWKKAAPVVLAYFIDQGATLTHKRISLEFGKALHLSEVRRANGEKGGRPRKLNGTETKPVGKATGSLRGNLDKSPFASPSPSPLPTEASEGKPSAQSDPDRAAWDEAKALLSERCTMSTEATGRFFGKLLADHGLEARDLLGAIGEARANGTQDPKSFLAKAAGSRAKRRAADGLTPSERAMRSNIQ